MKKRCLAMLLASMMVVGTLAACGQAEVQNPGTDAAEKNETKTESSTASEAESSAEPEGLTHPLTTEPITLSLFVSRNDATIKAEDTYFIQYLEYWMEEQGYDITFEIQEATDTAQQKQLMLGTNDVPDLVWGPTLSNTEVVTYGVEQGVVLDWTPYLNEKYMPNLTAILEANPHILDVITAPDGKIYALPQYSEPSYGARVGGMYVDKQQLDELGLEVPTTIEELLDVLRAVKADYEAKGVSGETIPLVSLDNFLNTYLWYCLGYYGTSGWTCKYGNEFRIKDGKLAFPTYSEDYATFIEVMNTLYTEGLISQDYLTMDTATVNAYIKADNTAMFGSWSMGSVTDWENWICLPPVEIGGNNQWAISMTPDTTTGIFWTSAQTEHPEVLAYMLDYLYTPEASMLQSYGPLEGQDPLGLYDGAYYDEATGSIASRDYDAGEDTSVPSLGHFQQRYFRIVNQGVMGVGHENYTKDLLGAEQADPVIMKDKITGEDIVCSYAASTGMAKHWIESCVDAWGEYQTRVVLSTPYLSADETETVTELKTVINDYIATESAKFIVGDRPLDEVDDFQEELKGLGIEDYIAIYADAYAPYLEETFK